MERRIKQRINFAEPVQFQLKDPGQFGGCLACDLSETGMKVNLNDFVPLNTEMMLQVKLASEEVVDCLGRIVWVEKLPFGDRYRAGLEFVNEELIVDSRNKLNHYIQTRYR